MGQGFYFETALHWAQTQRVGDPKNASGSSSLE